MRLDRGGVVLGFAVAEGPVAFGDFDEVDEDVFAADAEPLVQAVGNGFVEGPFHFHGAAFVEGDLDEDAIRRAGDVQVGGIEDEVFRRMFGDDLEAVIGGNFQGDEHGLINNIAQGLAKGGGLALDKINSGERHGGFWLRVEELKLGWRV